MLSLNVLAFERFNLICWQFARLKFQRLNVIAICLASFCSMALQLHVLAVVRGMPPYACNAVGLRAARGLGPGRARSGARRARNGKCSLRSRVGLAMRLAQFLSELSAAAGDVTSKCSLHSHSGERARYRSLKKWRARCRSRVAGSLSLAESGGAGSLRSRMRGSGLAVARTCVCVVK